MEIKRETTAVQRARADLLAVPLRAGVEVSAEIAALDLATGGRLLREVRQRSADPARRGCVSVYQTHGELPAELIALIGVGKAPADGSLPIDEWRRFAGAALGAAQAARARVACVSVGSARLADAAIAAGGAAIEGALLSTYRFEGYRKPNHAKRVERVVVLGMPRSSAADAAARRAVAVAEATCFARDLVNTPAEDATPAHLGRVAERLARRGGLQAKIFAPRELRRFGMGAILGVGRGSRNEPRLIELIYRPRAVRAAARRTRRRGTAAGGHVALVGKGITFDSGGLSLKTPSQMEIQKRDMAGGAAVLGAMQAIANLKPNIEVRGYVASAENMPGGDAYRPGDVLRACTGKTIEVMNTDAEGRLVLADALGYAAGASPRGGEKPRWIVDIATLTGAVTIALGRSVAGVMGNRADLVQQLIAVGRDAGEPIWELPLVDDYAPGLESLVADLKNVGDGSAGSIFGGLFLREFVGDVPWAHLDIAAVAFTDKALPYAPRGAVGWGVRTLVAAVEAAARA